MFFWKLESRKYEPSRFIPRFLLPKYFLNSATLSTPKRNTRDLDVTCRRDSLARLTGQLRQLKRSGFHPMKSAKIAAALSQLQAEFDVAGLAFKYAVAQEKSAVNTHRQAKLALKAARKAAKQTKSAAREARTAARRAQKLLAKLGVRLEKQASKSTALKTAKSKAKSAKRSAAKTALTNDAAAE